MSYPLNITYGIDSRVKANGSTISLWVSQYDLSPHRRRLDTSPYKSNEVSLTVIYQLTIGSNVMNILLK